MTSFDDVNVNREPLLRNLIASARRAGKKVKDFAEMFGVSLKAQQFKNPSWNRNRSNNALYVTLKSSHNG